MFVIAITIRVLKGFVNQEDKKRARDELFLKILACFKLTCQKMLVELFGNMAFNG